MSCTMRKKPHGNYGEFISTFGIAGWGTNHKDYDYRLEEVTRRDTKSMRDCLLPG